MSDWRKAFWHLYWHIFYDVPRKETLRRMIACGLTARQAIEEMREYEGWRTVAVRRPAQNFEER